MPYIYSLGYKTWQTGAPFMRALPLDFPGDPKVADLRDEYMFGPAFLVAPVTEQGATSRAGLSAGRAPTGTTTGPTSASTAARRSPSPRPSTRCRCLCARARSFPLGSRGREHARGAEPSPRCASIPAPMPTSRFSPTMARPTPTKTGAGAVTKLVWNDAAGKLTHTGAAAWTAPDASIVEVVQSGSAAR